MGKIMIIKDVDFSAVAVDKVIISYNKVTINVVVDPTGSGTVSGGGTYYTGDEVTISATPSVGYIFSQWSDGNTDATRIIYVGESSETFTAIFTEVETKEVKWLYGYWSVNNSGPFSNGTNFATFATPISITECDTVNFGDYHGRIIVITNEGMSTLRSEFITGVVNVANYNVSEQFALNIMSKESYDNGETAPVQSYPIDLTVLNDEISIYKS